MNPTVEQLFHDYLRVAGDDTSAAATLALAAVMQSNANRVEPPPPDQPLTVRQAAKRLCISPETVYGLVARGELGHHRIGRGRSIRFRAADIQEYQRRMAEASHRPTVKTRSNRL